MGDGGRSSTYASRQWRRDPNSPGRLIREKPGKLAGRLVDQEYQGLDVSKMGALELTGILGGRGQFDKEGNYLGLRAHKAKAGDETDAMLKAMNEAATEKRLRSDGMAKPASTTKPTGALRTSTMDPYRRYRG